MRLTRTLAPLSALCLLFHAPAASGATTVPDWWEMRAHAPFQTADGGVVAWGGKLFVLGGYLSDGQVGIYDPLNDFWKAGAPQPSPYSFPNDACVGRTAAGLPVAILFPEGLGYPMHRYYLEENRWDEQDLPAGLPHQLYLHDTVSMLPLTGENVCYISGGRDTSAFPTANVSSLLRYRPDTNTVEDLGDFTYSANGFEWHASWHAPWVGTGGAICVAGGDYQTYSGGAYHTNPLSDTQCYDLAGSYFRSVNADIGELPQAIYGAADMQRRLSGGVHELWLAGTLTGMNAVSYVWDTDAGFWRQGPPPPRPVFRQEGDALDGALHLVGGFLGEDHHQVIRKPRLTLLYPNGGETIPGGSPYTIRWAPPAEALTFRLTYSLDGGLTWRPLAAGLTSLSHSWPVPAWARTKRKCLVKVEAFNALGRRIATDRSNGRFTVVPPAP